MNAPITTLTRFLLLFLTLTVSVPSLVPSAHAQGRDRPHARLITPEFTLLEIQDQGDVVTLDYAIEPRSWRAIRQAGILPRLHVYVPNRRGLHVFRDSVEIRGPQGQIQYAPGDLRLRGAQTLEVELVGQAGGRAIRRIALGDACDDRLRVPIQPLRRVKIIVADPAPPIRPARPVPSRRADLIDACRAAATFDSDFGRCLAQASMLHHPEAPGIVHACAAATKFSSDLFQCIDQAGQIAVNPVHVTRSCGAATTHASDLHACLTAATRYARHDASPVVDACARHTRFGSDLAACVTASQEIRGGRVSVIEACGQATRFRSDFEQCLEVNQARQRRASF